MSKSKRLSKAQPTPVNVGQTVRGQPNQVLASQTQTYQGPIPQSQELARYEAIHAGLASRIVGMAEQSIATQHSAVRYSGVSRLLGQFSALAISLLSVGGTLTMIYFGKPTESLVALLPGLGIVVNSLLQTVKKSKPYE